MVGLDVVAKLEGGGVLATGSLVDLDFVASKEVFLFWAMSDEQKRICLKVMLMYELKLSNVKWNSPFLDEILGILSNISGLDHFIKLFLSEYNHFKKLFLLLSVIKCTLNRRDWGSGMVSFLLGRQVQASARQSFEWRCFSIHNVLVTAWRAKCAQETLVVAI